jgi:arginine repressor
VSQPSRPAPGSGIEAQVEIEVLSRLVVAVSAAYFKPMLRKPLAMHLCVLHVEYAGHLVCICVPPGISMAAKALLDNVYLLRL